MWNRGERLSEFPNKPAGVIPAKAGIHGAAAYAAHQMGPGFRRGDTSILSKGACKRSGSRKEALSRNMLPFRT